MTKRYVLRQRSDCPHVDQPLASEDACGDVLWLLADNQGTIRDVAEYDAGTETTSVVNHLTYGSFGQITSQTNSAYEPRHTYTGREWDADAELFYYRARWYDPHVGRFISEDPIGFAAGDSNLGRYVGNSPANATDPTGWSQNPNPIEYYSDGIDYYGNTPPAPAPSKGNYGSYPSSQHLQPQLPAHTPTNAVIGSNTTHVWFEFEYDLSGVGPVIIRAEMYGDGYRGTFAPVPALIDIKVWPAYGEDPHELPQHSTLSTRYRPFEGTAEATARLYDWLNQQTERPLGDVVQEALRTPGDEITVSGAGLFGTYGVPACGGMNNCTSFAGAAMSVYTGQYDDVPSSVEGGGVGLGVC